MEIFKIVKDNNKKLREKSIEISLPISEEIKALGLNMLEYLIASQDDEFLENHKKVRSGVGLAAPQIGKNIKMIALCYNDEKNVHHEYVLVNPTIISESSKRCYLSSGEGCLSVDKPHEGYIYRAYRVKVKCFDLLKNEQVEYNFSGYGAIVVQHEIDHLNGVLFYDHINVFDPFKEDADAIKI